MTRSTHRSNGMDTRTDTFDGLGFHTLAGGNAPVTANCPTITTLEGTAASGSVTATDADGTVTSLAITGYDPSDPGTISLNGFTAASGVGETASATLAVSDSTPAGTYSVEVTATNADETPQTATCTASVTVEPIRTIGEVQGAVTDTDDGATQASPYVGQTVYLKGVWTERALARASNGSLGWTFFLQNTLATDDDSPLTSDGISVYNGRFSTIRYVTGGPQYAPQVGDEVVIRGSVSEYFGLTELGNPFIVSVLRHGVDLSSEIAQVDAAPPHLLADAHRYWERLESMYVHLPQGASVIEGRNIFSSTYDGEMWMIAASDSLMERADPYARRVFRDPHPLDDLGPTGSFDNGNGERILLTSHGLKGAVNDSTVIIGPSHVFQTTTSELSGAVSYAFSKYGIEVTEQPALADGADPAENAPPQPATADEYATSDYNVENLYDYRDDPTDGCDFGGNSGCPGVSPPFDYVPASEAAYQQHLADIAAQINGPMHDPDLLMIQEAEDQDVCSVVGDALDCGTLATATDTNPDGKPDVLQELALTISADGGPTYDAAFDRDGADARGIISAFLFRSDKVELLPAVDDTGFLGTDTGIDYRSDPLAYNSDVSNPKAVNAVLPGDVDTSTGTDGDNVYTRAPQVGHFRIWRTGIDQSVFIDLWAVSNHFSSTPDARVGQRTEQAAYNAAIFAAIEAADPGARIVSAGDFNVYPRPDDPFAPGEPYGAASVGPSDQLGPMYDAGLHNLWDDLVAQVPASAYSYVYEGQAQTLDMQWANDPMYADFVQMRAAHINADWAVDYAGDPGRGASDHDPQVARWANPVTIDQLRALVDYFVSTHDVSAKKAYLLYDRLDRAEAFLANGQHDAYASQLIALGEQAQDLVPKWVSAGAADALQQEAEHLAMS